MVTAAQRSTAKVTGWPCERAQPRAATWGEDLRFALGKPLGGMGLIIAGSGTLLFVAAHLPLFMVSLLAAFAYFWLYNNYFFKTIQVASVGRDELPDSPSAEESLGILGLIWMWFCTYLGLAAPILLALAGVSAVPALASHLLPTIVVAALWPAVAYPMTVLLTTLTRNPFTAFHYPSIAVSIMRTIGSYAHVLVFFFVLAVAPQAALRLLVNTERLSDGGSLLLAAAHAAWSMYTMMALGLMLGRFYVREKARLGWFNG